VRPGVGQPDHCRRVVQQLVDVVGIVVDHVLHDAHVQVGFERHVEHPVHRVLAGLVSQLLDVAALELRVVGEPADLSASPPVADLAAGAGLFLELGSPVRVGVVLLAAFEVALGHRSEAAQRLVDEGRLPAHLELDRLHCDLREHGQASVGDLTGPFQLGTVAARAPSRAQQGGPADVCAGRLGDTSEFVVAETASDGGLHHAARVTQCLGDLDDLVGGRGPARHGPSLVAHMGGGFGGGEAQRTGPQRLGHQIALGGDLFGRAFTLGGFLAHDIHAGGSVADERRHVDRSAVRLEGIEVLREGLEAPVAEAGAQRIDAHALHVLERAHDQVTVLGPRGRNREAAVAHHDGGHAVPRRAAHQPVPHDLGVVVGVDVHEPGAHDAASGVDGLGGFGGRSAERHHLAVGDADVADVAGRSRPVDDRAARDLQVIRHVAAPVLAV